MSAKVLGIRIDDVSLDQAVEQVDKWLKTPGKYYIVTPNPEILVAANQDPKLKEILNNSDLSIPDGQGLKLSGKIKNTTTGVELMEKLVQQSSVWAVTVGFIGGRGNVAQLTAERLRKKYPKLKVSFASEGGIVDDNGNQVSSKYLIPTTDILFVAFGHKKQEKWIASNLNKMPVKVAMAAGGSFDYLSGQVPRAPKWLRKLGLEWLFRLIIQPWRIKRQLALIKYLYLLFIEGK